jgi:cobalt-zinc-cadmium efflux system membrane fusion protein
MKIAKLLYFVFASVSACMIVACGNEKPALKEEAAHHDDHEPENMIGLSPEQSENAGIELGSIEQKQISGTIKVNGVLDVPPQQLISISVPLGGFVKNTTLLQGSKVKKGQTIATIENLDFIQIQQDYLEAKGQLELARSDYERQQTLAREKVNSQKTLQQSRANYFTWQARYGGLHEKLKVLKLDASEVEQGKLKSSITLYSPIDGYVTAVNVNIGKFVDPTDVLFEIVDTEHLHAELTVFEKDVPKLKIGQKVRFTLANETKERMATVYLIGRQISADRTVRVHCHIDQEDKEMLPGMYLSGLVEAGGALVPALPNEAISDFQGKKYIFVFSGEKAGQRGSQVFTMLEVRTSHSELGFTEVEVSDSVAKSQIVIKGAYFILSKLKNNEEEGHDH